MIIFIVGPTGVGKSDAGHAFARAHNGEIVSCDAMQVYREVNIACDKPTAMMLREVPYHALNLVSVTEEFDAAQYRRTALAAIDDIQKRGRLPVVVGGSGMYMSVLLDGLFDAPPKDEELRARLIAQADAQVPVVLHAELSRIDAAAAAKIHPNDTKRIVRALEVAQTLNKPISSLQPDRQGLWQQHPGQVRIHALERPREEMYTRVEARIDRMFDLGLVEEVRALSTLSLSRTAATLIGIPEVSGYLNGTHDLERAKYLMKLNTRHYVKRQMTWFRRDKRIQWYNAKDVLSGRTPIEVK